MRDLTHTGRAWEIDPTTTDSSASKTFWLSFNPVLLATTCYLKAAPTPSYRHDHPFQRPKLTAIVLFGDTQKSTPRLRRPKRNLSKDVRAGAKEEWRRRERWARENENIQTKNKQIEPNRNQTKPNLEDTPGRPTWRLDFTSIDPDSYSANTAATALLVATTNNQHYHCHRDFQTTLLLLTAGGGDCRDFA